MRVLVTGGTGFIGTAVRDALSERGVAQRLALRAKPAETKLGDAVVVGEIHQSTDWRAALSGVSAVVHLAARVHVMHETTADPASEFRRVNTQGTEHLARAAASAGVRRLVFVSSVKVNGESTDGRPFSPSDAPHPGDPYGVSKWEAEQALARVARDTGLEIVVVRPPLVYGPHVRGNFLRLMKLVQSGIPLPFGSARNLRSLVFVRNLADALVTCVHHAGAAGRTFLVSDGEDIVDCGAVRAALSRARSNAAARPGSHGADRARGFVRAPECRVQSPLRVAAGRFRRPSVRARVEATVHSGRGAGADGRLVSWCLMVDALSTTACAAPVLAFVSSAAMVRWLVAGAARRFALDHPNERSLHSQPVPRLGGAGIVCGLLAGWSLVAGALSLPIWLGTALLAVVSLVEDVRGVPMAGRFLAHFVAATFFVLPTLGGAVPAALLPLVVIGIVWVTNLYNFMDGSDGLAGGMAVFGFGAYAVGAWLAGSPTFALASSSVAAAAAAFLLFNFAPAKIFMGDVGSIPLGFLAASVGVAGWTRGIWPAWFPFLVFSPFLVDASVTVVARQLRGEKVWRAHRSHYYQRLVLMGWGHRRVAVAEYALMLAAGASSLLTLHAPRIVQASLIAGWVVVYAVLLRTIDRRWVRFEALARVDEAGLPGAGLG